MFRALFSRLMAGIMGRLCIVNMLVDNIDRKGGYISGHAAYKGDVKGDKRKPSGIRVDTAKAKYQGKSRQPQGHGNSGYAAPRGVAPNFFAGARIGYPYKIKAYLITITTLPIQCPTTRVLLRRCWI